jgi:hypothetical protein
MRTIILTMVLLALAITIGVVSSRLPDDETLASSKKTEKLAKEIVMESDSTPTGTIIAIEEIGAGLMRATVELDEPLHGKVNATYSGSFITQSAGIMGLLRIGDRVALKKFYFYNYISSDGVSNATRGWEVEWIIWRKLPPNTTN